MLKRINYKDKKQFYEVLESRNATIDPEVTASVLAILQDVKNKGDEALKSYTEKFDKVSIDCLLVSEEEMEDAYSQVDEEFISILKQAKQNIEEYHNLQLTDGYEIQKEDGVYLGQRILPLNRVGIYVPGGTAAYPSTVLMDVIPAKIAGVKDIVMVTPPNKDGKINPFILATAKIAGVNKIYKVGGAQAIAALAYGTKTIPQVDKIVGPGNMYVAEAKKLVYGQVDIDMIAGPSEILVIADENANPKYIAADLMSQAEHDRMASSILVSTSQPLINQVEVEIEAQMSTLSRIDIMKDSFQNYGYAICADSIDDAIEVSNKIAPEHLEMMVENPKKYLPQITNAGSIFLGYYTCESIGDYFGGTNHVLPTNGTARFYSPLGVDSFMKKSSYMYWSAEALQKDGKKIIRFAEQEGLDAHANAVKVRLDNERY
ncbi:histidinol dehydrogenase [Breznakia sp. PF5-3]|uniref:histidinol dehydrogenase n=1 Tax=unclassified Breznakia TaxID=2623764 RepID=UPI002406689E|nr:MULTISPECIES: histidinol dehydrogenase [unclassified Breznakia]MDF9825638.1 histidinol dehydrogenase [Breznakia sp. PM6-1]MDF9836476.1 histidinol dehydrogenase [Breznakia sp. PF5-3]